MFSALIRAILLYILITFCVRLMGKRQLGELQPSELVITILISNIASLPIEDPSIPLLRGAIPVLMLVGCELLISNLSLKFRKFRIFVSGSPVMVIENGVLNQRRLRELRFSIDDLTEALRQNGIFDFREVDYAVVETTGQVSVLQKAGSQPPTADDLNLKLNASPPPIVIISDGEIIKNGVESCEISLEWINSVLKKRKLKVNQVFLMTCTKQKDYYIVEKNI